MIVARTQPLAGFAEDLQTLLANLPDLVHQGAQVVTQAQGYLPTIQMVLDDPALPAVVQRVNTIRALEVSSAAASGKPASAVKGIGLQRVIPALDAYIWYRKNPWLPWAALGVGALAAFKLLRR